MIDRKIPFKNIIMKCSHMVPSLIPILPSGFSFNKYLSGDEIGWASLEYLIGDFSSHKEALNYFLNTYLVHPSDLANRGFFIKKEGEIVATCIAWYDTKIGKTISSLHWLVVHPNYENLGLGSYLIYQAQLFYKVNNAFPIYIHTQPWSYKAIYLYNKFGFNLLKSDTFSSYSNDYVEGIDILKQHLSPIQIKQLLLSSE